MTIIGQHRIVCAAIRCGELIICGVRHKDRLMRQVASAIGHQSMGVDFEEGFVDNNYEFQTREQAMLIARKAGQIISDTKSVRLYSEDLY